MSAAASTTSTLRADAELESLAASLPAPGPGLRILLVSYFYPPCSDTGAHRPSAMAKYLRRLGHEVTVLTTLAYGRGADDEVDIVRSTDAQLWRARLHGRKTTGSLFDSDTHSPKPHFLSFVVVPEPLLLAWAPFAIWTGTKLLRRKRFDVVLSTSPVESAHFVGKTMARLGRAAWVADVRDAWTFEPLLPRHPTRFQRWLNRWLEKRWFRAADRVVCVSIPAADDLRDRLGIPAEVVHNGADDDMANPGEEATVLAASLLDPDRVSLVYTGRFGSYGRNPEPLVRAIERLAKNSPDVAARLELVIAGPLTTDEDELMRSADTGDARINIAGTFDRETSIALQKQADVLLVVANSKRSQLANFKLFEYLAAGRPILALSAGTEGGRIVTEAGGETVDADDLDQIERALVRIVNEGLPEPKAEVARYYSYPAVAERMAAVLVDAVTTSR